MRKLIASAALVGALLVPAHAAFAADAHVLGTRPCSTPYTGWIVYYVDPLTGEHVDVVALCIEIGE